MRTWMADLTGLAIGFALGGAVLVHVWPRIQQLRSPPRAAVQTEPSTPIPPPSRIQTPAQLPAPQTAPVPTPDNIVITVPAPAPLPQVTEPGTPDQDQAPPPPGMGIAGTGFFVASHLVMTAAHVVPACSRVAIVSPRIAPSPARVAAIDHANDIALLRTPSVTAPAILAIGRPSAAGTRVFMLGYPRSAGLKDPEATWGTLENDKVPQLPGFDPRQHILMEAATVRHGYSGGAIFDPRSGKVVGLVRAILKPDTLRMVPGMPDSGLAVGPGSALLDAFLQDEAPGTDAFPAGQWGEDPITVLKRATVHVLCWP